MTLALAKRKYRNQIVLVRQLKALELQKQEQR